jgi:hypothetical protein
MLPLGIGIDRARKLYLLVFGLALLEYAFRVGDGMVGWVGILYIHIYMVKLEGNMSFRKHASIA